MDSHQNARTTPYSRAEIVRRVTEERQPVRVVAQAFGISERTVRKWAARASHAAGLQDRSCRPHRSPWATPPAVLAQIEALRRARWTAARIAPAVALSRDSGVGKRVTLALHLGRGPNASDQDSGGN